MHQPRFFQPLKLLLACLLVQLLLPNSAVSQQSLAEALSEKSIQILLSSDKSYYHEVLDSFQNVLTALSVSPALQVDTLGENLFDENSVTGHGSGENNPVPAAMARSILIIAIGANACEAAIRQHDPRPLFCTFLPRSTFQQLQQRHQPQSHKRAIAAIHLDQPTERYFALIKTIMPEARHLGTAVGPESKALLPEISRLSDAFGLTLHHSELAIDTNPVATLTPIVEASDVFLANPDRASLNRVTAKWLLYLSIRQRIPVIAFSKAYVNAGALAAIYSSPADIGRDTGEAVAQWLTQTDKALTLQRYPKYFTTRTNPSVARALGIHLPESDQLQQQLLEKLGKERLDATIPP